MSDIKLPISAGTPVIPRSLAEPQRFPLSISTVNPAANYSLRLQNDPTLLVEDASDYKDAKYVSSLAALYLAIAKTTELPLEKIKKVRIHNMEIALEKMAKEQKEEYKELCKFWGVVPQEHRSKKPTSGITPHRHLNRLTRWGYFDLFFPNLDDVVELVIQKTYTSKPMSKMEMAKYAHIFVTFIVGHSLMPYDVVQFKLLKQKLEGNGEKVNECNLKETLLAAVMSTETRGCWNASMLYHMYTHFLMDLPDGFINLDAVMYFMELIDFSDKLLIKEFVDMLSADSGETSDFKALHLSPLSSNIDVRDLKERIFPFGVWDSDTCLFTTAIPEKQCRAYRYAYNRFEKNGYVFGQNVESIKTPYECRHAHSKRLFTMHCYQYAKSPLSVRVSDENELWMMRIL